MRSLPFALLFLNLFYLDIVHAPFQAALNPSGNEVIILKVSRQTRYLTVPGQLDTLKHSHKYN